MLEEDTPVIALLNNVPGKDKTLSNAEECKARGARVIAVVSEGDEQAADGFDDVIVDSASTGNDRSNPNGGSSTIARLSYRGLRGCDVDQPRNLAKSVTVE